MTILLVFHFGTFDNFKPYYQHFILLHLKSDLSKTVSYNRFVELESRLFFKMMFVLQLCSFGRCTGITYADSTMIPVCNNLRHYANKVFKDIAGDGKGTMGWCHDFKLHLLCNDRGEIITFCLTTPNISDKDRRGWAVLGKKIYGKLFADGVHLVTGIKANMKNRLMSLWNKIMLRKRYIIECINEMLNTTGKLVHTRQRSLNNFIIVDINILSCDNILMKITSLLQ